MQVPQKGGPADGEDGRQQEHGKRVSTPSPCAAGPTRCWKRKDHVGIELRPVRCCSSVREPHRLPSASFRRSARPAVVGAGSPAVPTKPIQIDDVLVPDGRHPLAKEANEDPARRERERPDRHNTQQHGPESGSGNRSIKAAMTASVTLATTITLVNTATAGRVSRLPSPRPSNRCRPEGTPSSDSAVFWRSNRREQQAAAPARAPGRKAPGRKAPGRKAPGQKAPGRKAPGRRRPVGRRPVGRRPVGRRPVGRRPIRGHRAYGSRSAMFCARSRTRRISSSVARVLSIM